MGRSTGVKGHSEPRYQDPSGVDEPQGDLQILHPQALIRCYGMRQRGDRFRGRVPRAGRVLSSPCGFGLQHSPNAESIIQLKPAPAWSPSRLISSPDRFAGKAARYSWMELPQDWLQSCHFQDTPDQMSLDFSRRSCPSAPRLPQVPRLHFTSDPEACVFLGRPGCYCSSCCMIQACCWVQAD